MSRSEDYLDHLLQDVSGGSKVIMDTPEPDDSFILHEDEQSLIMGKNESDKDFLEEFERELLADDNDVDAFLKQFEREMDNPDENFYVNNSQTDKEDIDKILDAAKNQMQGETSENFDDMMVNTMDESFEGDEMESSLGDMLDGLEALSAEGLNDTFMQGADRMTDDGADSKENVRDSVQSDNQELMSLLEEESNTSGDEDLMSMLGGESSLSGGEDLISMLGGENNTSDDGDLMSLLGGESSISGEGDLMSMLGGESSISGEGDLMSMLGGENNTSDDGNLMSMLGGESSTSGEGDLMSMLGGESSTSGEGDLMSMLGGESSTSGDEDLMSLLSGESNSSDDQDLMALLNEEGSFSNIEEGRGEEDFSFGITEEDPFAALAGMTADGDMGNLFGEDAVSEDDLPTDASLEAAEENESGKKGKKTKKSKKEKKIGEDGEKESFFAKLSRVLFGEDEEEEKKTQSVDPVTQAAGMAAIEELTDENLALLKELNGSVEEKPAEPVETPEEKKKREKKELKEKKAKERKEKKEQKAKEKKEKKANKPKKEKKPKPPKEPDNTPPLPKVPVFLIFVMAGSMLALVMIGTNLVGYSNSFANAESAYEQAEYVEAFAAVSGMEVKEADVETYEKYRVMAVVAGDYDGYENLMAGEFYDLALDSLVCTVGRYEKYKAEAEVYGCVDELNTLEEKVENELKSTFGVSKDKAIELYSYEEREDYSLALYQILKEAGYEKVTEE